MHPFSLLLHSVIKLMLITGCFLFTELSPTGGLMLKPSHDYWQPIQGQLHLHVTGKQCCDLAVWTTKDLQVIRIVKDDS